MVEHWSLRKHDVFVLKVILIYLFYNSEFCWSLNEEGEALLRFKDRLDSDPLGSLTKWRDEVGVVNPCLWDGVKCYSGFVVYLNLKDFGLVGTLAPDLGKLIHIKSIILHNNSLYGSVPDEILRLEKLEVLDLGYNYFSKPLPSTLSKYLSILVENNMVRDSILPEIRHIEISSEVEELRNHLQPPRRTGRNILRIVGETEDEHRPFPPISTPRPPPPPLKSPVTSPPPVSSPSSEPNNNIVPNPGIQNARKRQRHILIMSVSIGSSLLILVLGVAALFYYRANKAICVKPQDTTLPRQLQETLIPGIPKLKRSELESACEDFSNVVGTSSIGTIYKGTLSSGTEIAVISLVALSSKDWSTHHQAHFRNKIDTLSEVNHRNFINLVGYCEEEEPFTRMLVFEYAPNGTLFEHLHIKEAEHLDWEMRIRILMGIAYCLEFMHQSTPPIYHKNLTASSINLTEDYAAKISDFGFWDDQIHPKETMPTNCESNNVYSFGVLLFEMMTGRLPYSVGGASVDWASEYLTIDVHNIIEMVDPMLTGFLVEQFEEIFEIIRHCVHPHPNQRPSMVDVCSRLRSVTGIGPDGAAPKMSRLWWADLEIMSTEAA